MLPRTIFSLRKMQAQQPTRKNFLSYMPAEISIEIFSHLHWEARQLTCLFLVNRQFHDFFSTHEAALVHAACHPQNWLDYLLVLKPNPTYAAFFELQKEKTIFDSIKDDSLFQTSFKRTFAYWREPNFHMSTASPHLLYAGFLYYTRSRTSVDELRSGGLSTTFL